MEQAEAGEAYGQASSRDVSAGPDGRTMQFQQDAERWASSYRGLFNQRAKDPVRVLRRNHVLAALTGYTGPITISPIVATAITAKHPDVPAEVWSRLPDLLADPDYVFPHSDGGMNFSIEVKTRAGEPIVIGIRDGEVRTITPRNDREGATGDDTLMRAISAAMNQGGKSYVRDARRLDATKAYSARELGTNSTRQGSVSGRANPGYTSRTSDRQFVGRPRSAIVTRDDVINRQGRIFYQDAARLGSIQFPAGGVGNGETVIRLFQTANLSTTLHESGHYFLAVMQDLAAKGEPSAASDFAAVKTWWRSNADAVAKDAMGAAPGVKITADDVIAALDSGTTGDFAKDAAIDIGMHEQWSRGFEAYLMEGKAPSVELRSAFEKFRSWLISVYRRLTGLNVAISDDIRAVFDRMIASDEEIAKPSCLDVVS